MNLKNINNLVFLFKTNIFLLFWFVLFILFGFEILSLKPAIQIILNTNHEDVVTNNQEIRVNFEDYYQAVNRIRKANSFQPTIWDSVNPFGTAKKP